MLPPRIILTCPHGWSDEQAMMLAERLLADALPATVGVCVDPALGFMEVRLREPSEDDVPS